MGSRYINIPTHPVTSGLSLRCLKCSKRPKSLQVKFKPFLPAFKAPISLCKLISVPALATALN